MYRKAEVIAKGIVDAQSEKAACKAYEAVRQRFQFEVIPVQNPDGSYEWEPVRLVVGKELDELYADKPSYQVLNALVAASGKISKTWDCGLAIILLTILVKLLLTPLTRKQFQSMKDMQKLQPEVKKLQEKFKGNPQKLNQEVMAMYKQRGVNPLGGCFPLLIQMPILIWLYRAIMQFRFQFEGERFLWVPNLAEPDMPLLVLYLISMIVSQKLTTMPSADPQQQQTQKMMAYMMPIMFAFFFKTFPAAFILYWFVFNILSTVQQYFIMRSSREEEEKKLGVKTLAPASSNDPEQQASPAVSPPQDLESSQRPTKKKRRKKRRRKR
jgi:YidC/Oxa1 family membrane protein insertase